MTREELEAALRRDGMSGVIVKRIMRLAGDFATLNGFFTASKGDIMKSYSKISPGNKHGLGDSFWAQLGRATQIFRSEGAEEKNEVGKVRVEHVPERRVNEMRMMKLGELKTIVEFMELCDVEEINVVEIVGFLDAVKMRQKKPDDEKPGENQESK